MSNTLRLFLGALAGAVLAGCTAPPPPGGHYTAIQQDSGVTASSGGGQRALGDIPNSRPLP